MKSNPKILELEHTNFAEAQPINVPKSYLEDGLQTTIVYNIPKFFINALKFRSVLKEVVTSLAQKNLLLEKEIMQLNKPYKTFKAEIGGMFYDLAPSNMSRKKGQILSFESITVIGKVDDYTDNKDISIEHKSDVLDCFLYTLKTGKKHIFDTVDLTVANVFFSDIYNRIKASKQFQVFYDSWKDLSDVVKDRIKGDDSLENSMRMGYNTAAMLSLVPYLENDVLPSNIIKSAGLFGSYVQILDDITDAKIDESDEVKTFAITNSVSKEYALQKAQECYSSALALVDKKTKAAYRMLDLFSRLDNIHNNIKIKYA